jgi:hypothetical protein
LWQRGSKNGPQESTDPTRLFGSCSISQTGFPQRTIPARADTTRIHDAHAAFTSGSAFVGIQRLACRTTQRTVGLGGEGRSCKASHRCLLSPLWWSVGDLNRLWGSGHSKRQGLSLRKLRRAHGSRMKTMTQFQTQIPHPLADYLPEFLPTLAVRTPAIRVLLLIFIGKNGLEGSPV